MKRRYALVFGVALLTVASSAQASTIIFNGGGPDQNNAYFADSGSFFTMVAEPFSLVAGQSIVTDAHWWGTCSDITCPGGNFTIDFYTDNSGAPGSLIQSFSVGGASQTLTGLLVGGQFDEYSYSAVFAPLALTPGTTYWFGVGNNTGVGTWAMETTNETGSHQRFETGTGWTTHSDALAFNLTTTVPEPATLSLLGLGLLAAVRRARQGRSN